MNILYIFYVLPDSLYSSVFKFPINAYKVNSPAMINYCLILNELSDIRLTIE